MNAFACRDKILNEFRRESNGSFSVVYRALSEASHANGSALLDVEDVKQRIRRIVHEQEILARKMNP